MLDYPASRTDIRGQKTLDRLADALSALSGQTEVGLILSSCLLIGIGLAFLLILPGKTFSYQYGYDMMVFLDGADRVVSGQIPNRDFHTPLGLLAYLLPALGLWAGGSFGAMMPYAMAAFALLILPILIYVCASRLRLEYALAFALFVLTLVLTPASVGEQMPTFAMFYNRWGYALLAMLFMLALPSLRGPSRPRVDGAVAAIVLLLSFYLKISYFGIAFGFMTILLLVRPTRLAAATGLVGALAGIAVVHLFWMGTANYFDDIASAAKCSGVLRGSMVSFALIGLENAGTTAPFVFLVVIAWWRGASLWTLFLCLFMAGAGLVLSNQNAQGVGLLTLIPAAIVAAQAIPKQPSDETGAAFQLAGFLLVATIAATSILFSTESLLRHTWMALRDHRGSPSYIAEVDGFTAEELARPGPGAPGLETLRSAYRTERLGLDNLTLARSFAVTQVLAQPEYLWTVQDAVQLVRSQPRLAGKILTLDMANPFNALLNRSAPVGVDSWYHLGRTFSETVHPTPSRLFADVDVVLVPKAPVVPAGAAVLMRLYGGVLNQRFERVATSDYWHAYARRTPRR